MHRLVVTHLLEDTDVHMVVLERIRGKNGNKRGSYTVRVRIFAGYKISRFSRIVLGRTGKLREGGPCQGPCLLLVDALALPHPCS